MGSYSDYRWGRILNRSVRQVSEDFYEVKLEISFPHLQPGDGEPNVILTACNTVTVDSTRNAAVEVAASIPGGSTWYYEAENTQHDPVAFTGGVTRWKVFAGDAELVDLTPADGEQGISAPFPAVTMRTGTFTVTDDEADWLMTAGANYDAGTVTTNECWRVRLWRVS